MSSELEITLLSPTATMPTRGSEGAAGYDLYAAESVCVNGCGRALVSTDVSMAIPVGYYGRIAPRSGLSVKTGLIVNAGVIDSDYRGIIKVLLQTQNNDPVEIKCGERIAQIIFEKIGVFTLVKVESLDNTVRGGGGFGSTGT